jgi:Icc-related predicted phosphoesterase
MHISKLVTFADPRGDVEAVRRVANEAGSVGANAILLIGSLTLKGADPRQYGRVLKALAEPNLPAFYIPGSEDAPFAEFLREAANFEVVFPHIHCVHGTFAMAPHTIFSGMGGAITDSDDVQRDEIDRLRYPGWEVAYRLKFLRELKDYDKIFLFTTWPEHKGLAERGSSVLAEMIKTYSPRLVVVNGAEPSRAMIGTSQVVSPGSLAEGNYASIDLRNHEVTPGSLRQSADAA